MSICTRFIAALLLVLPTLLHAEQAERWYQVEVIIFAQNNPAYHDSEIWPLDYTLPAVEKSRELVKDNTPSDTLLPPPFSLIAADKLQLTEAARRVRTAGDVELLLHLGWYQPGLAEGEAIPVHIYEGMLEKLEEATEGRAKATRTAANAESKITTELPRLDGTLRLILSRYLHLESDLIWRRPLPGGLYGLSPTDTREAQGDAGAFPPASTETTADNLMATPHAQPGGADFSASADNNRHYQIFRQQQSRRMRSGETHYIDHPLFGIVVLVTPYQPPVAAGSEKSSTP